MSYRMEPAEIPGEFVRVDKGQTNIRGTLDEIGGLIGETYSAVSAIMRFIYGEDPMRDATRSSADPVCFAAALADVKVMATETMDLAVMLAKRMGA